MSDAQERLEREARWQRSRRALSWPEKIRLAEGIRDDILALRRREPVTRPTSDGPERAAPRPPAR